MTVPTSTAKSGPYAGAGTVGPFTVGFRFLEDSHLQVIQTTSAGVDTTLALTTNYTVSGAGATSGSVTLLAALPVGQKLTIIRSVPFTQDADYVQNDAFPAESHERALDKLTMQSQQLSEAVARAAKLPVTSTADAAELVADITLLADNITGLTTIYGAIGAVNTVAGIAGNVTTVAGISAAVTTVAGINAAVTAVNANATNVNTVATNIANVNTVGGNSANVTTVAGISGNVTTVAGNNANVTAVAGNATNINAAVANATNINAAVANATNINSAVSNAANITTVAGVAANVTTVAGVSANVNTVATNIASVNSAATNMAAIIDAPTQASNALTSANNAAASYDSFDDRYLGPKASDPTLDNDGAALLTGALYFNSTVSEMRVRTAASTWVVAAISSALVVPRTSTTGAAIIPTGTTAQRDASPVTGYLRYNTTSAAPEVFSGTAWSPVGGGATGAAGDTVFVENSQAVTASYTLSAGKNASSTGPITVNTGITVTVPTGSRWVVL